MSHDDKEATVSEPKYRASEPAPTHDDKPLFVKGKWSDLDHWTCKMPVERFGADGGTYKTECNWTCFGEDELHNHMMVDH